MRSSDRIPAIMLLVALAIGGVAWCSGPTRAHDQYQHWQRPDVGGSCCGGEDCRPTAAWLGDDGLWRVPQANSPRGLVIPASKVLQGRAADLRCHVCIRGGFVLCFMGCDVRG